MINTIEKGKFTFLIYQKKDSFIGICKETGYVEEAENFEVVFKRLMNGTKAILEAVVKNPELINSINNRPPGKYCLMFYLIPIWYGIKNIFVPVSRLEVFNRSMAEICA